MKVGFSEYRRKAIHTKLWILKRPKWYLLQSLSVGFDDLIATAENIRPGSEEPKLPEVAEIFMKATSNCCGQMCNQCCCMCCIQCCSKMNDQCVTTLAQLCTALACIGCLECCSQLCCPRQDGHIPRVWISCCILYKMIFFTFILPWIGLLLSSFEPPNIHSYTVCNCYTIHSFIDL